LDFPENLAEQSFRRQYERESARRGEESAQLRSPIFTGKIRVYQEETLSGLALLKQEGIPIIRLDATLDNAKIAGTVYDVSYDLVTRGARMSPPEGIERCP
jgi:hypothetical protein